MTRMGSRERVTLRCTVVSLACLVAQPTDRNTPRTRSCTTPSTRNRAGHSRFRAGLQQRAVGEVERDEDCEEGVERCHAGRLLKNGSVAGAAGRAARTEPECPWRRLLEKQRG